MQRFPLNRKGWQSIVLVVSVIAVVVMRFNRTTPSTPDQGPPAPSKTERRIPPHQGTWQHLTGCTLVEEDKNNDGDSFTLRHGGEEFTFRLYYADCPEKRRHQYNGDRIAEQGQYFGGLSEAATIAVGQEARDFTLALLRKGPVIVDTRWEEVYDSGRRYAFVSSGGVDLAEALVGRGLARIHTKGVSRPGGLSIQEEKAKLQQLERGAKAKRLGAWGKK